MQTLRSFAAAAVVVVTATFGAAKAQDQSQQQDLRNGWMMGFEGRGMMGYGPGSWMMGRGDFSQAMCSVMTNHIEGRLAYIKTELKISETQDSLWDAYATMARDNANAMRSHCTIMMSRRSASPTNLPERLDQHEKLMAAQLEATRAMNKALKPLYAAFSEAQKKIADQLFWGPMGMM